MSVITANFAEEKYFDNHAKIIEIDNDGLKGFIAIHRHFKNFPSFGATRLYEYDDQKHALIDVLRLSHLMTYKSLAADLFYGGAKAVLFANDYLHKDRENFFKAYAEEISKLSGDFITGSDVGVYQQDVLAMKKITPYVSGVKIDPSFYTALGVVVAMEKSVEFLKLGNLTNKKIGIDGAGKVGYEILKILINKHADIYLTDINNQLLDKIKNEFPQVNIVPVNKLYSQTLDIYCPCALSDVVTFDNYKNFQCRLIIGAANNQLVTSDLGDLLWQREIIYLPDYLVNAGGLISVVSEYEGVYDVLAVTNKVIAIGDRVEKYLVKADELNRPLHRLVDQAVEDKLASIV